MSKFIDLTGKRFGRLLISQRADDNKWKDTRWLCKCDCGKEKIICGKSLKSSTTKSCGCLSKEISVQCNTKHGHTARGEESKTYASWKNINERCINPKNRYYHCYGGRGITVCQRWRKFTNFLIDMGKVPPGYQIDRIDNNKGYCKSNCRWATKKEQARNRRDNHLETHNGKTQCLIEWAEEFGIASHVLRWRLKHGWSTGKALTTPVRKKRPPTHQSSKRDAA